MGIIQKQALRSIVINFIGIGFGAVSRILLPFLLSTAYIGVLSLIDSISAIFVIVFNLGYPQIMLKLFPVFRDEKRGHYGFLIFGLALSLIGIILGVGSYYLLENFILESKSDSDDLLRTFVFLIPILIFFRILFINLDSYIRMLYQTVFGVLMESIVPKLISLVGVILFWLTYIDFEYLVYTYAIALSLPGLLSIFYAFYKTKHVALPQKELFKEENKKKIGQYMLYGMLMGASGSIVLYVDQLMIHNMISIEQVGVYSILFFAASLINIPARGLSRISTVMIADSWKENDLENIQTIYQKSCLNQLLIGSFLFIVGWACLDSVLYFLPEYAEGKYVFFFLGIGQVIDMATGVNAGIIATSDKYKYNTYFNLILAVLVIAFNLIFIKSMGIVGAGLASFCAMFIVNFTKWYFLKKVYGFQPFNWNFLKAVLIGGVMFLFAIFIDVGFSPIYTIIFNFIVISIVFWFIVIKMRISEAINQWLQKIMTHFT